MFDARSSHVTGLLQQLRSSGAERPEIWEQVYGALYEELRRLAHLLMASEPSGHLLQPTELIHEAFLKLVDSTAVEWQDRAHFLAVAARAMRQVLVDQARRRKADKRGGDWDRITLEEDVLGGRDDTPPILELEDAMIRLAKLSERAARVAEMRIFAGMVHKEIAEALRVSERTVAGDWAIARKWLGREMATRRDGP